jgi:hypothetical protein
VKRSLSRRRVAVPNSHSPGLFMLRCNRIG